MLLVGTRSLERWTERIFVSAAAKRPSTAIRTIYRRQKLLGIRQFKTNISHEGSLQTQIKAAKGPLLGISGLPIKSCDIVVRYDHQRSGLALSQTLLDIKGRPESLINQLQNAAGYTDGSVSTYTVARILAARLYSLSPLLVYCSLKFEHPLDAFLPNQKGQFAVKFGLARTENSLRLSRTTIINFNVTTKAQQDVILVLQQLLEYLPLEFLDLESRSPRLAPPYNGEDTPQHAFAYDIAVARELSHHIPLQVGRPALKAVNVLAETAHQIAYRIAPKDHFRQISVHLSGTDPLRGSHFGFDQNMMSIMKKPKLDAPIQTQPPSVHRAVIALGSNLDNRIEVIESALQAMESRGLAVQKVSPLYETEPMYVLDQGAFLNGVCEIQTVLGPMELLDTLQDIEQSMGRVKIIEKGPRNIDLDILMYNKEKIDNERLIVPHKLMLEREFVLEPLARISPDEMLPGDYMSFRTRLLMLQEEKDASRPRPSPVVYIQPKFPLLKPHDAGRPTHVMAILNVTPDSFSDGGKHFEQDVAKMTETIHQLIKAGATIIDVGGQSTRPNATPVTVREEINRIVPVVNLIRSVPEADQIAISVDTFHSRVAKAAIDAGADIINDISGGTMDPDMFATVAAAGKTMVISHTRGNPQTMTKLTDYPRGVVSGVAEELLERVKDALAAGIRPWRIILDPGIGFAKNKDQNLELLRNLARLRHHEGLHEYPWLIGTSRKKFVGTITGVNEADERIWGTAATITSSIREGADIVRVHDVQEMTQVAKMTDAIYRVRGEPMPLNSSSNLRQSKEYSSDDVEILPGRSSENNTPWRGEQGRHGSNRESLDEKTDNDLLVHLLMGNNAIATDGLNDSTNSKRR